MAKKAITARNLKVADQIQRDLAYLIQRELQDSRLGLLTLQSVELTPDYAHAKVFYTILGADPEMAQQLLETRAGYLRSLLFKRLHIHTIPTLHFCHDRSIEQGAALSALIDQALADDKNKNK